MYIILLLTVTTYFGVYNVPMYTILLFIWTLFYQSVQGIFVHCTLNTVWLLVTNKIYGIIVYWVGDDWRIRTFKYVFDVLFKCCMFSAFMFNLRFLCVFCLFVLLYGSSFIMNFSDVNFLSHFLQFRNFSFRELFFTSIEIFFCVYDKMHAGWNEMLGGGGGVKCYKRLLEVRSWGKGCEGGLLLAGVLILSFL